MHFKVLLFFFVMIGNYEEKKGKIHKKTLIEFLKFIFDSS